MTADGVTVPGNRRLPRAARREQLLAAATEAFARSGFAATSLDDVAHEAGVTRMVLYTHFESKLALYQAALDRMRARLLAATRAPDYDEFSINKLLDAAADDPAGFRLLFHHAAREPEFRSEVDQIRADGVAVARRLLAPAITEPRWAEWVYLLVPTVTLDAVMAWLDAGRPDRDGAATRIRQVIEGIVAAAQS
jgi:AcrR family transcriptional regulator